MFRYQQIRFHFEEMIRQGILSVGSRLPSLRTVKKQFECSLSVAQQAYKDMEHAGIIRSLPKSGFFVCAPRPIELPSPQKEYHSPRPMIPVQSEIAQNIIAMIARKDLIKLHGALPAPEFLPLKALKRYINQTFQVESDILSQYAPNEGSRNLRQEISLLMASKDVMVKQDEIVITQGCSEGLFLALKSCTNPGDTIAVESPAYFGMISMLEHSGLKVIAIPVDPCDGFRVQDLADLLKTKPIKACLLTANFQNPTGALMPEEQKRNLVALAEKHDFIIVEDDLYGDCGFIQKTPKPIKAFDHHNHVIYYSSFSKSLAPGMRIGWMIAGQRQEKILNHKQQISLGGPMIMQEALAAFLAHGKYEMHLTQFRRSIGQQVGLLQDAVARFFPEGTRISDPQGGLFLWIELPESINGLTLYERALKHHIGIAPGCIFSMRGSLYNTSIRLSCGSVFNDTIAQAIQWLGQQVRILAKESL